MEKPFFIFGCPRSGTSLLRRMLGTHSKLAVPFESHLYNAIFPLVQRHGYPAHREREVRLVTEVLRTEHIRQWNPPASASAALAAIRRPDFHGLVDGLMRSWCESQGKSRWGEKTPQHTLCWQSVVAGFPQAQVIHLVRDGRDVALSYKSAVFGPKHVYHLAQRWRNYLRAAEAAQRHLGEGSFLQVRYEDLVRNPQTQLRKICDFLGEEFEPAMLDFYRRDPGQQTDAEAAIRLRRPVNSGNTEKWRTGLTGREIRIFEAVAGENLERYGYELTIAHPKISSWEELYCRFIEHPPRRIASMVKNRQGCRLAIQRLRIRFWLVLDNSAGLPLRRPQPDPLLNPED